MYSYIKLWWFAFLKVFDGNTETDRTFKFKTGKGKVIKVLLNVILIILFMAVHIFSVFRTSNFLDFLNIKNYNKITVLNLVACFSN